MSLVETNWLQKNLENVKIIDCSWHMPQTKRDGFSISINDLLNEDMFQEKHLKIYVATTNLRKLITQKEHYNKIIFNITLLIKFKIYVCYQISFFHKLF